MSYKNLEVWRIARELVVGIHEMTVSHLPKFELFEEGSQIRRSIISVKSNIVEGYGRREYKQEFVRYITYALASCIESLDHLETLWETGSLSDKDLYESLHSRLETLGRKLNLFLQSLEDKHMSKK